MQTDVDTSLQSFVLKAHVFTFPVLQVLDANPEIMPKQIECLLAKAPQFFNKAPFVIDLQFLKYNASLLDFQTIKQLFYQHHLYLIAVRGGTKEQQQLAENAGLATLTLTKAEIENRTTTVTASTTPSSQPSSTQETTVSSTPQIASVSHSEITHQPPSPFSSSSTKLITKPIRSGQQIYAKNSDLIILAPVSAGAEVLADGHIHIYGPLRGRALAGIHGNKEARIFCQSMEAELIAIAGVYLVNEALSEYTALHPTQIYLEEDILKIESLPIIKHD